MGFLQIVWIYHTPKASRTCPCFKKLDLQFPQRVLSQNLLATVTSFACWIYLKQQQPLGVKSHPLHVMCNVYANYMLTHLIRRNKSVRQLKSVLWCGDWLGECGALVCLSSEGLPARSHSSLQTPCIIKQRTSLLGGIVCVLFETSETLNHILLSSAASNRFRLRLSGTTEFSVRFYSLFSLF